MQMRNVLSLFDGMRCGAIALERSGVSNTQRYKMLGNGWTVDVIAHILKGINLEGLI